MSRRRLAIVFCAHHKPWLMMASLVTLVAQGDVDADVFVAYNIGDGALETATYAEYRDLAARDGVNTQLSPFDPRVREVSRLSGRRVVELEYLNDQALDSGCWYKFIRDGRWRDYDFTLFVGEGTLFAHPHLLAALLRFADARNVHFVASGHEKRRLPKSIWDRYITRGNRATDLDRFHDRMIAEAFGVFERDPAFAKVYARWGADFDVETEHHVPAIRGEGPWQRRLRSRIQRQWGSPADGRAAPWLGRLLRTMPATIDRWRSRAALAMGHAEAMASPPGPARAFPGGAFAMREIGAADDAAVVEGVGFHRVEAPEWFGCATNHLMSHAFLTHFSEKLEAFQMYDVLDLPFAGTPLEVIWGMLPAWLGVEKWFTNGFHRVRKNFATYQREDDAPTMASYINRYYRGRLVVDGAVDRITLQAWAPSLGDLRRVLPPMYF